MGENGNGEHPAEGMVERPAPTLGEQLGLGRVWAPSNAAWAWNKLNGPNGPVHLLSIHTVAGVFGITLGPDDLRRFVAQALEQSSGLVLPGQ